MKYCPVSKSLPLWPGTPCRNRGGFLGMRVSMIRIVRGDIALIPASQIRRLLNPKLGWMAIDGDLHERDSDGRFTSVQFRRPTAGRASLRLPQIRRAPFSLPRDSNVIVGPHCQRYGVTGFQIINHVATTIPTSLSGAVSPRSLENSCNRKQLHQNTLS
jgi:hypothetical protein